MPPNLLVKAAFVRENSIEERKYDYKVWVRTDFIIQNIYSYYLRDTFSFICLRSMNEKENIVLKHLKELVNNFQVKYVKTVKELIGEIEIESIDTVGSIIYGVGNELFSEGITWSCIITFFVFAGEFTLLCRSKNILWQEVDIIFEIYSKYVKEKLEPWVFEHGGWQDITNFDLVLNDQRWYTRIILIIYSFKNLLLSYFYTQKINWKK